MREQEDINRTSRTRLADEFKYDEISHCIVCGSELTKDEVTMCDECLANLG